MEYLAMPTCELACRVTVCLFRNIVCCYDAALLVFVLWTRKLYLPSSACSVDSQALPSSN